jgi:ketosteroid isomerase-like protein
MSSARSIIVAVLVICAGAALSFGQAQNAASSNRPEDQIIQLERDWLAADAKGDATSLRRIIADDFIGSSFNGRVLNKIDLIPEGPYPGGFAGATTGTTEVRIFGDTAVLMGVINTAGKPQGKPIHVTMVCQKRPPGWLMIAAQLTPM